MSRREDKVIHAVACPACSARRGAACTARTREEKTASRGRLYVHMERRRAWQDIRKRHPPDILSQSTSPAPRGVLYPQSERARTAILSLIIDARATERGITVPDLRSAIDTLTADGWWVE